MKNIKLLFFSLVVIVLSDCSSTKPDQGSQGAPTDRDQRFGPPQRGGNGPGQGPGGPGAGGASRNNPEADNQGGNTFFINLDGSDCNVDIEAKLGVSSVYTEIIDEKNQLRKITINSIADHQVGEFPNPGNPNTIKVSKGTFNIPLNPKVATKTTSAQGFDSGVLFSGVSIDPFTAEMFIGSTGQMNPRYNITTLTSTENLGLDCNNAHVQPTGKYHYHGTPSALVDDEGIDGSEMVKIGYASDGFPIYYKYGYNSEGELVEHQSGYKLKEGDRGGDGVTAPDGPHNGRYFSDYKYDQNLSELDACNGRWGKTPESANEYYYVVTDNFPSVPLCFSGTPNNELRKGGGRNGGQRPQRGAGGPPPRRGGNHDETEPINKL
ncbi:YHYH protein [Roseivirga misakiensis]|nr:YHYH protein [Roseivirga misakiensis]